MRPHRRTRPKTKVNREDNDVSRSGRASVETFSRRNQSSPRKERNQTAQHNQAPSSTRHPRTPEASHTVTRRDWEKADQVPDQTIYGLNTVLEALRAGTRQIDQITIATGGRQERLRELLQLAKQARVPIHRVPKIHLDRSTGDQLHQGVVARLAAARYREADEILDHLVTRVGTEEPPLALGLDGIEDPRNLGAILRTAECAGVHGVFIPERRAVSLNETVARAAAGALEYVPVARVTNLVRLIEQLKERKIWVVGAAAEGNSIYTEWDWTLPSALFLGSEGSGLHRLVRENCDALVRIPLAGKLESLNVSVAAGVLLYEARRQRALQRRETVQIKAAT